MSQPACSLAWFLSKYDDKTAFRLYREQMLPDKAKRLWELAGCPHGRDLEFWCQAEREFDATFAYLLK